MTVEQRAWEGTFPGTRTVRVSQRKRSVDACDHIKIQNLAKPHSLDKKARASGYLWMNQGFPGASLDASDGPRQPAATLRVSAVKRTRARVVSAIP